MNRGTQELLEEGGPAPWEGDSEVDGLEAPPRDPLQARFLDGFLEIFAYLGFLFGPGASGTVPGFPELTARLDRLLERAEAFRVRQGFPETEWREALFAVCAWGDERILTSSWPGRDAWLHAQLQRRIFGTTTAGEGFFARLKGLGTFDDQVREVYDTCLSLGFKGRLFRPEDQGALRKIREEQLPLLPRYYRPPEDQPLFPAAGLDLDREKGRRSLPYRYLVYAALAAVPPLVFLVLFGTFRTILNNLAQPLLK
jgi:type VI secretion system protein ImpK